MDLSISFKDTIIHVSDTCFKVKKDVIAWGVLCVGMVYKRDCWWIQPNVGDIF